MLCAVGPVKQHLHNWRELHHCSVVRVGEVVRLEVHLLPPWDLNFFAHDLKDLMLRGMHSPESIEVDSQLLW
jgi:hypothetical protein